MQTLLESLIGTHVRFDQTGDVGLAGRLINIQEDYATIYTDTGQLIHYPFSQIKSVTANITDVPETLPLSHMTFPDTFADLLASLRKRMVKIENGEGAREGVLSYATTEHVCIVLNMKEMIYYQLEQIKNVSPVLAIKQSIKNEQNESSSPTQVKQEPVQSSDGMQQQPPVQQTSAVLANTLRLNTKTEKDKRQTIQSVRGVRSKSLQKTSQKVPTEPVRKEENSVNPPIHEDVFTHVQEPILQKTPDMISKETSAETNGDIRAEREEHQNFIKAQEMIVEQKDTVNDTNRVYQKTFTEKGNRTKPIMMLKHLKHRETSATFPVRSPEDSHQTFNPIRSEIPSAENSSSSFPSHFLQQLNRSKRKSKKRSKALFYSSQPTIFKASGS
ncbi:hypothetical protein DNHGIG_07490 [Collibacillus ludicampi]|uniref:DUF2642 domain-containing protein n=1 Tax=Collibacillus ludicampi TaxID=2771369 RepID=A0AAV4LBN1_9BACL|nr:hypothetical protein [Collibacillus ludicampi]GIM45200.1 hypothetical protein DNHGIG_07490 [Collibacillus ludicampi]